MPKVLLVAQPTTEGVAAAVAALVKPAVVDGWEVTVACPAGPWLAERVVHAGATWRELPLRRAPGVDDLPAVLRLRRLASDADVVHLHSSKAGATGRLALATLPRSRRPRSVFTPHAWSWMVGGRLAPAYRAVERGMVAATDVVVAVSAEERDEGIAVLGQRFERRARVIPNGVDIDRFSPTGACAARSEAPLIVCVGRLARQKGQDVAVRALARMASKSARLRLVGSGPDEDALRALATDLGVGDRVELTGFCADPAPHLRAADIAIVPSRWDGLSLSLLEAMACGRAVVATRVPGSAELVGAGIVIEPDDEEALATAMDELVADRRGRHELGQRARERAEQRFALHDRVRDVLELWRSLLG